MQISQILEVETKENWRSWLQEHYTSDKDVWFVLYKKNSGKTGVSYPEAVEEALCFGWIDSVVKAFDKESYLVRFSPRKPNSSYSQDNKQKLRELIREGRVMKDVVERVKQIL